MLTLTVDQEYTLSPEILEWDRGDFKGNVYYWAHMGFKDGVMAVHCDLSPGRSVPREERVHTTHLAVLENGTIDLNDISSKIGPSFGDGYTQPSAVGVGDAVLVILNADRVLFSGNHGRGHPQEVATSNKVVRDAVGFNKGRLAKFVSRPAKLKCPDEVVAVPIFFGDCTSLAFLHIETEPLRATWTRWPSHYDSSKNPSFLDKILGRSTGDITAVERGAIIEQAIFKEGRPIVTGGGHSHSVAWGHQVFEVSEVDENGKLVTHVYNENFTGFPDQKKRGRYSMFSSSGKYCCLWSIYKSTDPWKGKQRLLELDSGDLIELSLPRGYTKFRFVDHNGGYFWFALGDQKQSSERIIRCSVVSA